MVLVATLQSIKAKGDEIETTFEKRFTEKISSNYQKPVINQHKDLPGAVKEKQIFSKLYNIIDSIYIQSCFLSSLERFI